MKFYDTCSLIELQDKAFNEPFAISSVTIQELNDIKENRSKDPHTKYQAKYISKALRSRPADYKTVRFTKDMLPYGIDDINDNRIIACAASLGKDNVEFFTEDTNCFLIARDVFDLSVSSVKDDSDDYTGFVKLQLTDEELAKFYSNPTDNKWDIKRNEYVVINNGVDVRKWNGSEFVALKEKIPKTLQFGNIKAKDIYQRMAIDSIYTNKISMIKGHAGTGKTLLSLAILWSMLEKHEIDKIIIFCNPVATAYSAKLG